MFAYVLCSGFSSSCCIIASKLTAMHVTASFTALYHATQQLEEKRDVHAEALAYPDSEEAFALTHVNLPHPPKNTLQEFSTA